MWKDSNRNIVVIFQPNILRIVEFYVRHLANDVTWHKFGIDFNFLWNDGTNYSYMFLSVLVPISKSIRFPSSKPDCMRLF